MSVPTDLTATVFITNYNYGRFLPYAVESALEQTWPHVQVIVVDDGSSDESRLLLETYGDSITTLFKPNGGQASSVNAGFPLISGDAVLFLDSDDMLDPAAIEKSIGFFTDPEVVKVSWPLAVVDGNGHPTGEIRFTRLSVGNFRKNALKVGPASHHAPSCSGNIWRKSFLNQVMPVPEEDCKNIVDAYLFTFSPFFGDFRGWEEPLTFYRVHGTNITARLPAGVRIEHWENRAKLLHTWLEAQGEDVSIVKWRRNNTYVQRLRGILRGEAQIGKHLPPDAAIVLVAGRLYNRADIRPARPVFRPPDGIRFPERTDEDFRAFIDEVRSLEIEHIAVQGSATWEDTNLGSLADILKTDYAVLYEDKWIVIARLLDQTE